MKLGAIKKTLHAILCTINSAALQGNVVASEYLPFRTLATSPLSFFSVLPPALLDITLYSCVAPHLSRSKGYYLKCIITVNYPIGKTNEVITLEPHIPLILEKDQSSDEKKRDAANIDDRNITITFQIDSRFTLTINHLLKLGLLSTDEDSDDELTDESSDEEAIGNAASDDENSESPEVYESYDVCLVKLNELDTFLAKEPKRQSFQQDINFTMRLLKTLPAEEYSGFAAKYISEKSNDPIEKIYASYQLQTANVSTPALK